MTTGEDRQAICDVLHLYAFLADSDQYERIAPEIFTTDAILDWGHRVSRGRAELESWFARPRPGLLGTSHVISNMMVRLEGDTAKALYKLVAWHWFDDGSGPLQPANAVLVGGYADTLRREDHGWRVSARRASQSGPAGVGIAANMPPWLGDLVRSTTDHRPDW
jgi:hypothetical protein